MVTIPTLTWKMCCNGYPPTRCRLSASYYRTVGSLGRLLSSPSVFKDRKTLEIGWIAYTCPRQVSGHEYTMHKRGPYQLLNLKRWIWCVSRTSNPPARQGVLLGRLRFTMAHGFNGLLAHHLQGVMIVGASVWGASAFHAPYYRTYMTLVIEKLVNKLIINNGKLPVANSHLFTKY